MGLIPLRTGELLRRAVQVLSRKLGNRSVQRFSLVLELPANTSQRVKGYRRGLDIGQLHRSSA